jgi:hypothetical protein
MAEVQETYLELFIYQGANFSMNVVLTDADTNATMNIAGSTFRGRLKRSYGSQNVKANLVCTAVDAVNGVLNLAISSNVTANLAQGRYVHSVKMTTGNQTDPVLGGPAFCLPDV